MAKAKGHYPEMWPAARIQTKDGRPEGRATTPVLGQVVYQGPVPVAATEVARKIRIPADKQSDWLSANGFSSLLFECPLHVLH